jgi:adenylate kinase|tara:strand:- start:782 stop:1423 length:642 start_codon:yes stop_codon:yes gene_type:complete
VNIILFGPPGAGKGTQSQYLVENYNYIQISTGDLLRNEIKKNTNLGKEILAKIDIGDFVNNEIVNSLIDEIVSNKNYHNKLIFDGYPRNISQAENLDNIMLKNNQTIGAIVYLDVTREIIEKRILGRIVCEKCNVSMNEYLDNEQIKNHKCGKEYLKKRKDDNSKTIMKRYDTFIKETNPLLDYYSKKTTFYKVNASVKIEEISTKIAEIVNV